VEPLVLVILAVVWVLVLAPPFLRSRRQSSASSTVRSFRSELGSLGRMAPQPEIPHLRVVPSVASGHTPASGLPRPVAFAEPMARPGRPVLASPQMLAKRRSDVLTALAGGTGAIGMLAVVWPSAIAAGLFFLGLGATAVYVYLLTQFAPASPAAIVRQSRISDHRSERPAERTSERGAAPRSRAAEGRGLSDDELWDEFLEYRSAAR
jgi:hypothetical protein